MEYLDTDSRQHFEQFCAQLHRHDIAYRVNPRLVRGLDYYNRTVFEWVTTKLGAQGTVCAGGRYDALVAQLGGSPTPAVGFALGIERIVAMLEAQPPREMRNCDVYVIMVGTPAEQQGLSLAEELRDTLPLLRLHTNLGGGSFKSQMKRADKSGALLALILGEDECALRQVSIKFLREERQQEKISQTDLAGWLQTYFIKH